MARSDDKAAVPPNPLVLTTKASEAIQVHLHPLVLLTISDYITRHTLRSQPGPIVGAVIGAQNGKQVTLEHAFECKLVDEDGGPVRVDAEWFTERLESYRAVHKAPQQLELVGMFVLGPVSGPEEAQIPVMKQVQAITGQEGLLLLLFHPDMVRESTGGKLPITLYETVNEVGGEAGDAMTRFRELAFEVETGEAEMIGVDTVAKGGGSATATTAHAAGAEGSKKETKGKGKGKAKQKDDSEEANGEALPSGALSPEDDELIASLTAKANAIKMLTQRLQLIKAYLETLPTSYLTDASSAEAPPTETNHSLLRSVNSMLSRVPLLSAPQPNPTDSTTTNGATDLTALPTVHPQTAGQKERADVHLTSLLASLSRSVSEAQAMGSKFLVLQREKASKERSQNFGNMGSGGGGRGGSSKGFGGMGGGFGGGEGFPEGMPSGF